LSIFVVRFPLERICQWKAARNRLWRSDYRSEQPFPRLCARISASGTLSGCAQRPVAQAF